MFYKAELISVDSFLCVSGVSAGEGAGVPCSVEWCGPRPRIHNTGVGGAYPSLGVKRLSFLPLCVWRTTDCKHCPATKELESAGEMDGCY